MSLGEDVVAVMTDTVGFIRKLPHHLVAPFRSTLEEKADADIVLHVVDVAHANWEEHLHVGDEVLTDLGVERSVGTVEDYRKVTEVLRINRLFGRPWEIYKSRWTTYTFTSIAGIEPTREPWWSCPKIKALMEDPVGAHRATLTFFAERMRTRQSTSVVLPVPGPPVMTSTFSCREARNAFCCSGLSSIPTAFCTHFTAWGSFICGTRPLAAAIVASFVAIPSSALYSGRR